MNILILGDVVGPAGVKAVKEKLPKIIREKKVDFVILNGENAADSGRGITKKIFEEFLEAGADVITTGNHVWDHKDAEDIASKNINFLRPLSKENFFICGTSSHSMHNFRGDLILDLKKNDFNITYLLN